jgi:hypothetical protein
MSARVAGFMILPNIASAPTFAQPGFNRFISVIRVKRSIRVN